MSNFKTDSRFRELERHPGPLLGESEEAGVPREGGDTVCGCYCSPTFTAKLLYP